MAALLSALVLLGGCATPFGARANLVVPDELARRAGRPVRVAVADRDMIALLERLGAVRPVPLEDPFDCELVVRQSVTFAASTHWTFTILANLIPLGPPRGFAEYEGEVTVEAVLVGRGAGANPRFERRSAFRHLAAEWVDEEPGHYPLVKLIAHAGWDARVALVPALLCELGVPDHDRVSIEEPGR